MALRQRQPVASTSAAVPITSPSLPPSIAHLTPGQIKTLKQTIITEHFGFAPETFAKSGSDAVNTIVWVAVGKLGEWIRENRAELDDDDEIDAAMVKVETLLESAVDKHFDLFEIYVLRNTFAFKTELIPYIELKHHAGLHASLQQDSSIDLPSQYEQERKLYQAALAVEQELKVALEYMKRKVETLVEQSSELNYLASTTSASPLNSISSLSASTPHITSSLTSLLNTPLPTPRPPVNTTNEPWGTTRSSYINWATQLSIKSLPPVSGAGGGGGGQGEMMVGRLEEEGRGKGSSEDAMVLLKLVGKA